MLQVQFPANLPAKTVDDDPIAWVLATCVGEQAGIPGSQLLPDTAH